MILKFQTDSMSQLANLAKSNHHSILIEGASGCGKSYLAKEYARMIHAHECYFVKPSVQDIRDAIDHMYSTSDSIVLCIENLDQGVKAASYAMLKFLEEPRDNVYVIITCQNRYHIPDTIVSRSAAISLTFPTESDIVDYAEVKSETTYNRLSKLPVWKGVRSLTDIDTVYSLNESQLSYYDNLPKILTFADTVSNIVWKLQHYEDNTETNVQFVLNYIMSVTKSKSIHNHIIQCVQDLNTSRLSANAVLSKFVFECKYGE